MGRIKVIEYISNLGDGGAETLVKDYVCLLDRNRFDPIVVVLRGGVDSANKRTIEKNRIPIIEIFPHWNMWVRVWKKLCGWWYIPYKLKRIIRSENAKVMHMHLMVLKQIPHIGKALDSMRLVFTCHSVPSKVFEGERIKEKNAAQKLIKNNGMQLIALHDDMAAELNEMFGIQNTVVIRNGIDVSRFKTVSISKAEKRKELGIPKDSFVVGHVGGFRDEKNHVFLVDVFAQIVKSQNNSFLLMVGAGNSATIEQKLCDLGLADRYLILSHRTDVNEILRSMDVFVFPSKYEGLPLALVEAQYSGLRCIASEKITVEVVCTDNVILLPLEKPEMWASAVLDHSIKGSKHDNLDNYDMNKVIKRLERLYTGDIEAGA